MKSNVICNYCHTNNVWDFSSAETAIEYVDPQGWEKNPYPRYLTKQGVCHNCGNIVNYCVHIVEEETSNG